MLRRPARAFAVAVAAVSVLATLVGPAHAAPDHYSGRQAEAWWVTRDARGVDHVHYLYAYETSRGRADVVLTIVDYRCPVGAAGAGSDEQPCEYLGERWGEATGLAFTMGRQLRSAHLDGVVTVYRADGTGVNRRVALDWSDAGELFRERRTYRFQLDGEWYSETYRTNVRLATPTGTFGRLSLADAVTSNGALSSFRGSGGSGPVP